ncbi:hypothetical protein Spiaf_0062 [Spirochaeta africana DSM 8902]|uniref:Uncharacterized protein n=1 Tax=Spirochaeta africana (strain ATCC 700263 / DSM 8902 / Z-7692) TaxID=889378 RepID=H9UF78_SPIAZ|nr:hypothetical protein Spiaf_0062 [Spirochaeta africana DSM 8902]
MTESREILVLIEELINDYRYITEAMQLRKQE